MPLKGFGSAVCLQRDTCIDISLCPQSAVSNPFRGTHCINLGILGAVLVNFVEGFIVLEISYKNGDLR